MAPFSLVRRAFAKDLNEARHRQGSFPGIWGRSESPSKKEAVLSTLTEGVIKSSEIEGENLDREQVRSSLARRLGMDIAGLPPAIATSKASSK